ncbi:unnamed protein product, partial [Effrenium voratum]
LFEPAVAHALRVPLPGAEFPGESHGPHGHASAKVDLHHGFVSLAQHRSSRRAATLRSALQHWGVDQVLAEHHRANELAAHLPAGLPLGTLGLPALAENLCQGHLGCREHGPWLGR